MKILRIISMSGIGLLLYIGLSVFWGVLHFWLGTANFANETGNPNFWECVYFSFVTFGTIGYGDIISQSVIGQVLIVVQSLVSLLFVGIFGGYMAFQFLKRPRNILLSHFIYLKPFSDDILFTLRVGNKGNELIDASLEISVTHIDNDIKRTLQKVVIKNSLLEKSWHPCVNLSKKKYQDFAQAIKKFYNDPQNTMVRIIITGTDIETGESVGLYQYYKFEKLKISGEFLDLYSWKKLKSTQPKWDNFDKTESVTDLEEKKVIEFMQKT